MMHINLTLKIMWVLSKIISPPSVDILVFIFGNFLLNTAKSFFMKSALGKKSSKHEFFEAYVFFSRSKKCGR